MAKENIKPNKVRKMNVAGALKKKGAKAARLAKNATRLSGCVQVFLEGLDALELINEAGESVSAEELKKFGVSHVNEMANRMDELTSLPDGKALSIDMAMHTVLKEFESMHREWFKAQKGYFLVNFRKLDSAYALAKKNGYDIDATSSSWFGSNDHRADLTNKGSIAELTQLFGQRTLKPLVDGLEEIGKKYGIGANVGQYFTKKDLIAKVFDAYRSNATTKGVASVEVARVLREFNDSILRQYRQYGVVIPDLAEEFFTHQVHDPVKMTTPNPELSQQVLGISAAEYARQAAIPGRNIAKLTWKKYMAKVINWERSFEGSKKATGAEQEDILDAMWKEVIGVAVSGERPGSMRFNSFPNWVKGRKRQIFFNNGADFADHGVHYGTPNLINHIFNYTRSTSKNLAVFHTFGPNPEYVFNKVKKDLADNNPETLATAKKLEKMQGWFDYYTKHVDGKMDLTTQTITQMVKFGIGAKVSLSLGLKSTPDLYLLHANVRNLKLGDANGRVLKAMHNYFFKGIKGEESQKLAGMFSHVNDHFTQALLFQSKQADVVHGGRGAKMNKLSYQLAQWGGIHNLDESLKLGVRSAYSEKLALSRKLAFEDLEPELKFKLNQHGITPQEWQAIAATDTNFKTLDGKSYFAPFEVAKMSDLDISHLYGIKPSSKVTIDLLRNDLAMKSNAFISYQSNYVVPELNAAADKAMKGFVATRDYQEKPTIQAIFQLAYQFKSWSLNFLNNTLKRILQQDHKTYPQRAWDMAQLMIPLGAIYTAINHGRLLASNKKQPFKKHAGIGEKSLEIGMEIIEETFGQLGVLDLIWSQFSSRPRSLFPAAQFYGHLGQDIKGIFSPAKGHTRGDYISRLLGEVADTSLPTEMLWNWLGAKYFESNNERRRVRGD